MAIALLVGNMPHYDFGLCKVTKVVRDTLSELGMETEELHLGYSQVPFFDGITSQATDEITQHLRAASGVIFACTAQFFAPTAIMQSFLEYFALEAYSDVLREKPCFIVTVSQNGGERSVLEYLSRVLQQLGGYDCARIGLQETHTRGLENDSVLREIIEKETEDYYRAIRQNRKHIIPQDFTFAPRVSGVAADGVPVGSVVGSGIPAGSVASGGMPAGNMPSGGMPAWSMPGSGMPTGRVPGSDVSAGNMPVGSIPTGGKPAAAKREKAPVSEVYKRLNLDAFTEQQEQDIQELTRLFAEKHTWLDQEAQPTAPLPEPSWGQATAPRVKTVKQITQSLPHYFQPQLSGGLSAVIQLNVTGAENFDGYLHILNTECTYYDGTAPSPDITIITDAGVWQDVLKRKCTAQKAFMIGGLKVRGNFVLLTKFDALFKLNAV